MMDEDDEIQSPSPPHQNGRLSLQSQPVTVAEAPPQNILTLALPIQQPRPQSGHGGSGGGGGGGGGGREDCWSDGATSTLIDAWGERYMELSRGNLKQKHWQDVADIVSSREDYRKPPKTDVQCKNRIDTLKKKYKVEKSKILSGQGPSQWAFFHRLDRLIGANTKITAGITSMANAMVTATPATPAIVSKVPVAIPVTGIRTFYNKPPPQQQQRKPSQFQTHGFMQQQSNSSGSEAEVSPESSDSLPPETTFNNRKRPRMERELNSEPPAAKPKAASASASGKSVGKGSGWGNSIRELTQAIMEFGESYERAETSKLQQVVEMEKQRMGFAKELELQRMQFFMKTQLELTQLKHGRGVGTSHHHHSNNRNNSD